jgi:hypothetical protein
MNRDVLCKPFPQSLIRQRPGRDGKTLSYVETHAVIARLNEGCDQWSFEVMEHSVHDDEVVVLGKLTADGVTKMAFGGSTITIDKAGRVVSLADDLKSAASDSLKKCATLLGVGLELYGAAPPMASGPARSDPDPRGNGQDHGERITSRQLAAVWASCRRYGVTRDDLSNLIERRFNKGKVEALSKKEASALIDHFNTAPQQP